MLAELARARLANGDASIANTVQMGATVTYEAEGRTRQVTLVYPAEANIDAGCISVATPIGTALLGLAQGQSIEWTARDGRRQQLTILSVTPERHRRPRRRKRRAPGVPPRTARPRGGSGAAGHDDLVESLADRLTLAEDRGVLLARRR